MKAITISIDDTTNLSILERPVMVETETKTSRLTLYFSGGTKRDVYLENSEAVMSVKDAIIKTFGIL